MIFMISEKAFKKHDKKLLKVRDYVIIDGSDSGAIDDDAAKTDIANHYSHVVINGAFTPHRRLLDALKKEQKSSSEDIAGRPMASGNNRYTWKTQNMLDDFLESAELVGAMLASVKGFTLEQNISASSSYDAQRNIFIVLPNKVYRYLSDIYLERMQKLMDADFRFIYSEVEVLEKKKLLTKDLKSKKMDALRAQIPKVAKKYKLDK